MTCNNNNNKLNYTKRTWEVEGQKKFDYSSLRLCLLFEIIKKYEND